MNEETRRKWDDASRRFDLLTFADDRRLGPHKQRLFSEMSGATLMVGVGTGDDFNYLRKGLDSSASTWGDGGPKI